MRACALNITIMTRCALRKTITEPEKIAISTYVRSCIHIILANRFPMTMSSAIFFSYFLPAIVIDTFRSSHGVNPHTRALFLCSHLILSGDMHIVIRLRWYARLGKSNKTCTVIASTSRFGVLCFGVLCFVYRTNSENLRQISPKRNSGHYAY
jgi:hypothetical protein